LSRVSKALRFTHNANLWTEAESDMHNQVSLTSHRVGTNDRIGMLLVASQSYDASIAIGRIIAVIVNAS